MDPKRLKICHFLTLLILSVTPCYSQVTTVYPVILEDAYTYALLSSAGTNYGTNTDLKVYVSGSGSNYYRSFLKFDFSGIPTNAVILSAKVQLTPAATENVSSPSSSELSIDLCNTNWGEYTITHNSMVFNNTIFTTNSSSNSVSGKREFEVKDFVQAIVSLRAPNYGFRIRRNPESTTTLTTSYYSKESSDSRNHPKMIVQYYIPTSVSSATIQNATNTTSGDGAIYPVVSNGYSTSKTYQWYTYSGTTLTAISGANTLNLTGRNYGWYGLKIMGSDPSDVCYYGFIIGLKCNTFSVTVGADPNFTDDTYINNSVSGSGSTAVYNTQVNYGNLTTFNTSENTTPMTTEGLLRFRLWFDPNATVNSANLTLYGNSHAPTDRPNTSYLKLVSADWTESNVAYTNRPASSSSTSATINGIAAGNGNATINIANLVNAWKTDNTQNYGCHLQLTYYEGTTTKMQFNSSDAAAASRPTLVLNLTTNDCSNNSNLYYVPKAFVGPEIADLPSDRKLKIRFKDYFDSDGTLNYTIKCLTDDTTPSIPMISKDSNTNWIIINLSSSGIVSNKIYLLELTDSSGKKEYLKFKAL